MPAFARHMWLSLSEPRCHQSGFTKGVDPLSSSLSSLQLDSLLQGVDQSPKPLIIGPEEDYDPGYFNNEVTVSCFSHFVILSYQLLWARSSVTVSSWKRVWGGSHCLGGREHELPAATGPASALPLCPQPFSSCLAERRHIPGPGETEVTASSPGCLLALHLLSGRPQPTGKAGVSLKCVSACA